MHQIVYLHLSLRTSCVDLRSLSSETTGELEVFRLNGDSLGVDGSEVGVLELKRQLGLPAEGRRLTRETRYASDASWSAMTADDWNRRSVLKS